MLRPWAWGNFLREQYGAPQKAMLLLGSSVMQKSHQWSALLQELLKLLNDH